MAIRHQLAVYSPIPFDAPIRGTLAALRLATDPRPALVDLLRPEYGASSVLLAGSGTQALAIAIASAVHRAGADNADRMSTAAGSDPVIALPAFSCFDVASAAIGAGVGAALYDLDPDTLSPDLASLERVLASGVRVAVIAPLYGMPVGWDALDALASRYSATLIEDSAQGHGAAWRGRPLGALGAISTLSFGRGKGWTGGGGGAVLIRGDAALGTSAPPQPAAGNEAGTIVGLVAQWTLGRPAVYGIPHSIPALGLGETVYHPPVPPTAMPRAAAAAVMHALVLSQREAGYRRENARWFLERMPRGAQVEAIRVLDGATPGYLRLPIRRAGGLAGIEQSAVATRLGVAPSYPSSLAELAQLASRLTGPERRWPGAESLVRDLVTLPTHSRLSIAERDAIVRLLGQKA